MLGKKINKKRNTKLDFIFYVHKGDSEYLSISLKQAKLKNSNAQIILLGDALNNRYDYVTHVNINDYSNAANEFRKKYVHLSDKEYEYELFCFQRWFIILEYMRKSNISCAYYQDSDVILDCKIEEEEYDNKFWYCDCSGHVSAFNVEMLSRLCDFIIECYRNENELLRLFAMRTNMKSIQQYKWTNITDMELISLFVFENKNLTKNIGEVLNKRIAGFNINAQDHTNAFCMPTYNYIGKFTKIYYIRNQLFVKDAILNRYVKLLSIHFHTNSKEYMSKFVEYNNIKDSMKKIYYFDFELQSWQTEIDCKQEHIKTKIARDVIVSFLNNSINDIELLRIVNIIEKYIQKDIKSICSEVLDIREKINLLLEKNMKDNYEYWFDKVKAEEKKIIGWGTGSGLKLTNKYYNIKFNYFVDADESKIGQKINDVEIYPISEIIKEKKEKILIIILSVTYYEEIRGFLKAIGLEENKDFISMEVLLGYYNKLDLVSN